MKKISFLLSTLGGALAGYVFSNSTLRDQLIGAKTPDEAARILGTHLQKDGKKLGDQVKTFLRSKEVEKHIRKARSFVEKKVGIVRREVGAYIVKEKARAKKTVRKAAKRAKNVVMKHLGENAA